MKGKYSFRKKIFKTATASRSLNDYGKLFYLQPQEGEEQRW